MFQATQLKFDFPATPNATSRISGLRESWDYEAKDRQLVSMLAAFRSVGDVVSGDELAGLLNNHVDQPVSTVARWIVRRSIVTINWRAQTLVPLFQFDRSTMQLTSITASVLRELIDVFDDWDVAMWFSQPNSWLEYEIPVNLMLRDPMAVLSAAQGDRFIARG